MNKITADHLARQACVYIRQSTPDQVQHNLESQRRQYGLVDRARALGWQDIAIIDDDLGISGSGTRRPGFERLLRALCDGQVGAVFSIEASRAALLQKAQRGDLLQRVAIGYIKGAEGRIDKDPDARVRSTIDLIFR